LTIRVNTQDFLQSSIFSKEFQDTTTGHAKLEKNQHKKKKTCRKRAHDARKFVLLQSGISILNKKEKYKMERTPGIILQYCIFSKEFQYKKQTVPVCFANGSMHTF
jgi:hypothetical protein